MELWWITAVLKLLQINRGFARLLLNLYNLFSTYVPPRMTCAPILHGLQKEEKFPVRSVANSRQYKHLRIGTRVTKEVYNKKLRDIDNLKHSTALVPANAHQRSCRAVRQILDHSSIEAGVQGSIRDCTLTLSSWIFHLDTLLL